MLYIKYKETQVLPNNSTIVLFVVNCKHLNMHFSSVGFLQIALVLNFISVDSFTIKDKEVRHNYNIVKIMLSMCLNSNVHTYTCMKADKYESLIL